MTNALPVPHDIDAEESLLGAMMLSRGATTAALDAGVTATTFYKTSHAAVFSAAVEIVTSGEIADPTTVAAALNGDLERVGGRPALDRLQASTPASANAPAYARIIVEHERRRKAIAVADGLREAAFAGDLDCVRDLVESLGLLPTGTPNASWERVDLAPALAGTITRVLPTVLRREDESHLFYPSRVNGLHGDSGLGKSMVSAVAAAQELNAGHHVGWVDLEDPDPTTIIERLRMFTVDDDTIAERFHYWAPREPFDNAAVAALVAEATEYDLTMLVIDSVGEAFGLEGLDENKDVEVGPWLRRVARVLADAGPAVVLVDHATKAADNPLHPSGSKRKRAAITGASYLVEATKPLTREHGGELRLVCAKDRHGTYRRGAVVATVDLAVYLDGGVSVKVWPPFPTDTASTAETELARVAAAAVKAAKSAGDELLTQRRLLARMDVKAALTVKRAGIEEAVAHGALRVQHGPNRSILHAYVRDLDDQARENVS
jgi:KaiC/GvpD/RAD55 family RecA-like ATPase